MHPKVKKLFIVLVAVFTGTILLVAAAYSAGWYMVAKNIQMQIDALWADLPNHPEIFVQGEKPVVHGFPAPPKYTFSGTIVGTLNIGNGATPDIALEIPELDVVGFPLTGLSVYIEAPKGLVLSERQSGNGLMINYALLNFTLPFHMPENTRYSGIQKWQQLDDPFVIDKLFIVSQDVSIDGHGILGLDQDLQPDLRIEARIKGMDELFDRLAENTKIEKKGLDIAKKFLKMIIKTDEQSGEQFFETGFYIQSLGLFVGPMRIGQIEPIHWQGTPPKKEDLSRKVLSPE